MCGRELVFFFVCLFEKRSQGAQAGLTPDVRRLNLLPPLLQYSHSTGDRTHVLMHAKYIYQLSNGSLVIKFYLRCSIHILTGGQRALGLKWRLSGLRGKRLTTGPSSWLPVHLCFLQILGKFILKQVFSLQVMLLFRDGRQTCTLKVNCSGAQQRSPFDITRWSWYHVNYMWCHML